MDSVFIVDGEPKVAAEVRASCQELLSPDEGRIACGNTLSKVRAIDWDLLIICTMGNTAEVKNICNAVRSERPLSQIIVAFGSCDESLIAECLTFGADDCVSTPFVKSEFSARVLSALRRTKEMQRLFEYTNSYASSFAESGISQIEEIAENAELIVCTVSKKIIVSGESISLTKTEILLLTYLFNNRNRVCSKEELLEDVLGYKDDCYLPSLYSHMNRLRRKLEQKKVTAIKVVTVWGFGYKMEVTINDRPAVPGETSGPLGKLGN